MDLSFKGARFFRNLILQAVFIYVRYAVSYRDLEECLAERGIEIDHPTLNRWVLKYASALVTVAPKRDAATAPYWRLDEVYVKLLDDSWYLYRAVDRNGQILEFMLSELRDEAALRFLAKAICSIGVHCACAIDNSKANTGGLKGMNAALAKIGSDRRIRVYRSKDRNKIVKQDHRGIKRRIGPMMGFKSLRTARATLGGIEKAHIIRKW